MTDVDRMDGERLHEVLDGELEEELVDGLPVLAEVRAIEPATPAILPAVHA